MLIVGIVYHYSEDILLAQAATSAFALVIGLVFGNIFSGSFVKRLKKLGDAAREVSEGDLVQDIPVHSQDEIRDLEEGFAAMLADLHHIIKEMKHLGNQIGQTQTVLNTLVRKVYGSNQAIDDAAKKIAHRSENQSDIVQKTASIMDDSFAAMEDMGHRASQIFSKINEAQLKTEAGEAKAHHTLRHLEDALIKMAKDTEPMYRLASRIEKIKMVINFMDEVARKTDLLSLNASIEATRAGESGRGFALVADEIRNMADNTKRSSGDVRLMIEGIIEDNEIVTASLAHSRKNLDESRQVVKTVLTLFGETLEGVNQIAEALKTIETVIDSQLQKMRALGSHFKDLSQLVRDSYNETQKTSLETKNQQADILKIVHAMQALTGLSQKMTQTQSRFKIAD
jgi:methyl-accepting chemotaxis protein